MTRAYSAPCPSLSESIVFPACGHTHTHTLVDSLHDQDEVLDRTCGYGGHIDECRVRLDGVNVVTRNVLINMFCVLCSFFFFRPSFFFSLLKLDRDLINITSHTWLTQVINDSHNFRFRSQMIHVILYLNFASCT